MYPSDIIRIARYLDISQKTFIKKYTLHVLEIYIFIDSCQVVPNLKLMRNEEGCVFLAADKCKIHHVKPFVCRNTPFVQQIIRMRNFWDFFTKQCPGIGSGREYSQEDIKKLLLEEEHAEEKFIALVNRNDRDLSKVFEQSLPPPIVFKKSYTQAFIDYLKENMRDIT